MARLASSTPVSYTLFPKPKSFDKMSNGKAAILGIDGEEHETRNKNSISVKTTRRAAIGFGFAALSGQLVTGIAWAAEDNGFWYTGPIPIPRISNKIANEETGTRSFVRPGIYMANIGPQGSQYRLRKYAFDLLGLGDLIGKDAWSYMRKYLRLKSTFMYYDFDIVISAAPAEEKQPLTDLANRLFDTVEKLEDAVKNRKESEIISYYEDTTNLLKEVMTRMA
ncbi:photosynthetic NDH subunit of lumenal location 3, chloroplastic [Aristolochia californica]|uniref:photosynthetic NDH subunit of lumenal location 3, chloroplastic n=1 Tax=Aristolochia californica TaxID=171875 RepID=UPI0035DB6D6D